MVDVRRVKLPGVGVLHTFVTDDGGKVGVITHRSGHSDLITFSDARRRRRRHQGLAAAQRRRGAHPRRAARRHADHRVAHRARPDPRASASTGSRSTTTTTSPASSSARPPTADCVGLTVVAVVRGDSANPAPAPDFKVFPGDTLVVAGSPEKVAKAFTFFRTGELPVAVDRRRAAREASHAPRRRPHRSRRPARSSPTCSGASASWSGCPRSRSTCSSGCWRARTPAGSRSTSSRHYIELIAIFGLILLLFNLGLEFDQDEFFGNVGKLLISGGSYIVINMGVGLRLRLLVGWGTREALIIAGMTATSSSAIVTKLLIELRRLRQPRDADDPRRHGRRRHLHRDLPRDRLGGARAARPTSGRSSLQARDRVHLPRRDVHARPLGRPGRVAAVPHQGRRAVHHPVLRPRRAVRRHRRGPRASRMRSARS